MVLGFRGLGVCLRADLPKCLQQDPSTQQRRLAQVLSDRAVACGSIGAAAGGPVLCWDARALRRGVKL